MKWQEEWKSKLVSAEEAVKVVGSGDRVVLGWGPAEPPELCHALAERRNELRDVKIHYRTTLSLFPWQEPGWEESFAVESSFTGFTVRGMMWERRADFVPICYGLSDKMLDEDRRGVAKVDVFMVVVSPPNKQGFCSFGECLWNSKTWAKQARNIVVEVNENMIRTYGDNFIHVSEIDYLVENHRPLMHLAVLPPPEKEVEMVQRIAELVASLIKDGDTLSLGYGTIPGELCIHLWDRKELGIHAEVIQQGVIDLVKGGVINGKRKTLHPGKVVATALLLGEEASLDYVDDNPTFELYDVAYVTDPGVVAAHDNMVSINNALTIDLTGQVAAESIGPRMWSGTGGQLDLSIGAMLSRGGRNITVIPSTAKNGTISRITPALELGTIITVPRVYVDYVVSEYGIASLYGKSQRERAEELIAIAHPDFRAELKKEAQRLFYP